MNIVEQIKFRGGRSFMPHENQIFLLSSDSQAGGCEKIPKGIKEEDIGPKTTIASVHAPPPVTTRKNQSSSRKQNKIWFSLTSPIFQAGGCEKLPKGNEEKKIVPKVTAVPAHVPPPGTMRKVADETHNFVYPFSHAWLVIQPNTYFLLAYKRRGRVPI
jgi:hypothetical protein